ncbi:DUF5777 family beta-barrel protein [Hymenobacter koreensis]|uniref:DUF5777 family beta-barrel protein n=1 Tax=Hymenobacter koreensis TaxID=1084523 RepID=UPI0031E4FB4B
MKPRRLRFSFLLSLCGALLALAPAAQAQDDLLGQLEKETTDPLKREVVTATFKGNRIINSQSVEMPYAGAMSFLIQHRFGTLNSGAYNFFGLDQAVLRLGLEYGLSDRFTVGIGRSSQEKTFDGFLKYRALRQTTGPRPVPVTVALVASSAITTLKFNTPAERDLSSRVTYAYQVLIARKFNEGLSVQVMPTLIHRNYVTSSVEDNDVYALGAALRQKITKRTALTADYYYLLSDHTAQNFRNALGLGVDLETGGHVFQLHVTNSLGMTEKFFVPETTGRFFSGDIYFGFTVARNFTIKPERR